jgi:hypothetical protein
MVALCERFGSYKMYSEEPTFAGLGEGLPARWDAVRNFIKTGGRFGRQEATTSGRRTRTARGRPSPASSRFSSTRASSKPPARCTGGGWSSRPSCSRTCWCPLIVAMGHSGLFESWRMPIATGVAWFHDCRGGEFAFYPDGPEHPPRAHTVRYNTALLLDTDSVFHGVDRVAETDGPVAPLRPGMRLCSTGDRRWEVQDGDRVVARYRWEDLRFSVSWKAYCFTDEAERDAWAAHGDDLSVDVVVERMLDDMRTRGVIGRVPPHGQELVDLIIDTYVHYPTPAVA